MLRELSRIARARERRGACIGDRLEVRGHVRAVLRDEHGSIKQVEEGHNLVVSAGRDAIIERLDSSPATAAPSHMAIGTGTTAVSAGQTALVTEIDRNALTSNTSSGGVLTMVGNWAAGDGTNSAIKEAAVLNASSTGTMYSRFVFTNAIDKGALDTLQITWTYTLTPS